MNRVRKHIEPGNFLFADPDSILGDRQGRRFGHRFGNCNGTIKGDVPVPA